MARTTSIDQTWCEYWLSVAKRLEGQEHEDGVDYHLFTLTADDSGNIWRSDHSIFIEFTPTTPHFEVRQPSRIDPQIARANLRRLGEPPLVINTGEDFFAFLFLGGHGIIRRSVLQQHFPHWLEAKEVAPLGAAPGFLTASSVPQSKFVKRPRKRLKECVRERDGNKCLICGKGRSDGASLTLHHITMRKYGGFTEEKNLATVCRDCHDGIGELAKWDFYKMIGVDRLNVAKANRDYVDGVRRYCEIMSEYLVADMGDTT